MTSLTKVLPVIAGAVAGALIALLIAHGGSTKTVVEQITTSSASSQNSSTQGSSAIPASTTSEGGLSVNQIYKKDSPGVVDITTKSIHQGSNNGFFSSPTQTERTRAPASCTTSRATSSPTSTSSPARRTVKVHFQDGVTRRGQGARHRPVDRRRR